MKNLLEMWSEKDEADNDNDRGTFVPLASTQKYRKLREQADKRCRENASLVLQRKRK